MNPNLNRRDFLKLAGLASLSYAIPQLGIARAAMAPQIQGKNVLVIVFDALSAHNISLYGYPRETMPNLARLSERAVVYHNHYAAGNFTTPGTASLLTGTLPWTHRAFAYNGLVSEPLSNNNIFHSFPGHYRIAYSHNPLVNTLFDQFGGDLAEYVPRERLFLANDVIIPALFGADEDIATVSWARTIKRKEDGYAYSLFLSHLYERYRDSKIANLKPYFPRGLPHISSDNYFLLERAIDWIGGHLSALPGPIFGYFHFLPPHFPYKTQVDFYGRFDRDGLKPLAKPIDLFTQKKSPERLLEWRTWYDEFILYADRELGRLFGYLERSGILENSWIVLTSDHGEMFERGISGHTTPALHQPVVRVPLLIFEPGRRTRMDVHTPTSAIDVFPTLLHVTGQDIPDWIEGIVLPPYWGTQPDPGRSVFAMEARHNDPRSPLEEASVMLVKGQFKLTYYFGYGKLQGVGERVETFDLEADPEELHDLYPNLKGTGADLLPELKSKLAEANDSYR